MQKHLNFCIFTASFIIASYLPGCVAGHGNQPESKSKVSHELQALSDEYSAYLAKGGSARFQSSIPLISVIDDRVVVDATAAADANALLEDMEKLGMQQAVAFGRIVSGQLPIAAIPRLSDIVSLQFVRAAAAMTQKRRPQVAPGPR